MDLVHQGKIFDIYHNSSNPLVFSSVRRESAQIGRTTMGYEVHLSP